MCQLNVNKVQECPFPEEIKEGSNKKERGGNKKEEISTFVQMKSTGSIIYYSYGITEPQSIHSLKRG